MQKVQFDHFYLYDELTAFLREAAAAYPDYMRLETIAQTEEGRDVFLVTLADFSLGDEAENRGAYYVQSGIHAQEGAGTTAAIHLIQKILESENKQEILRKNVFYVIPRVNPDGAEYSIGKCAALRSKMVKFSPRANALIPKDMNDDGMILTMRWEDPMGTMKNHPTIPGYMIPRKPGDTEGPFYSICAEGYLENYDGGKPQFGMRNKDLNRSLPSNWNYTANNAGEYPCREVESRAVAEFLATHPNVFAGIDFHCGTAGILHPTTTPLSNMAYEDVQTIQKVGAVGTEITGLALIHEYDYRAKGAPAPVPYGCSNDFAYNVLGISHFVIELGNGYNGLGLTTREILDGLGTKQGEEWLGQVILRHRALGGDILVPWTEYDHPQLGKVEIGGLKDGQAYYMYPRDMEGLIPKTSQFLLKHAEMGPKLVLGNVETTDLGGGNYRIRAAVMNQGVFGTTVMVGSKGYNAQKNVEVSLDGAEILSRPGLYTFRQLGSMESVLVEWFVKGEKGTTVTLTASHPKSASAVAVVTL